MMFSCRPAAVMLGFVLLYGCSALTPQASQVAAIQSSVLRGAQSTLGRARPLTLGPELYETGGLLARYPLDGYRVGLPANATLNAHDAYLVAVAPDGTTYVNTSGGSVGCAGGTIAAYAPMWTDSSRPLYEFLTGLYCVGQLSTDSAGNLYVPGIDQQTQPPQPVSSAVFIYAPGQTSPMQMIVAPQPAGVMQFKAAFPANNGNLYVTVQSVTVPAKPGSVYVYANPLTNPTLVNQFSDPNLFFPVGIEASATELYVQEYGAPHNWKYLGIHVYPITSSGTVTSTRTIRFRNLKDRQIQTFDLFNDHLYVGDNTELAVFDALRGGRPPLQVLTYQQLQNFGDGVRVGP
jgi:hypothetical protein